MSGQAEEGTTGWRRWAAMPFILLVRLYQKVISPLTPPSCRFTPSCSAYAVTAFRRHGVLRGFALSARRLCRCHPWNPGGVDHVPERIGRTAPAPPTPQPASGPADAMRKSP